MPMMGGMKYLPLIAVLLGCSHHVIVADHTAAHSEPTVDPPNEETPPGASSRVDDVGCSGGWATESYTGKSTSELAAVVVLLHSRTPTTVNGNAFEWSHGGSWARDGEVAAPCLPSTDTVRFILPTTAP